MQMPTAICACVLKDGESHAWVLDWSGTKDCVSDHEMLPRCHVNITSLTVVSVCPP